MATFPTLKTGSAAQYPLGRSLRFQTQAVRFLDGSRQSFSTLGKALRAWKIDLDLLDDRELASVIDFAELAGTSPFFFTDPVTGDGQIKCMIAGEESTVLVSGEMCGKASLVIQEIV